MDDRHETVEDGGRAVSVAASSFVTERRSNVRACQHFVRGREQFVSGWPHFVMARHHVVS